MWVRQNDRAGWWCSECNFGSIKLREPPLNDCPRCELLQDPREYPAAAVSAGALSLEEATQCIFRGEQQREVSCGLCGSRGELLPVFQCLNIHVRSEECTPSVRGAKVGVAVCLGCDHQQEPGA